MNNVERARCIIQEFNKHYRPMPCCCPAQNNVVPGNVTFTIGTVTTGLPGSQAAASITGTYPNFILNLTIPQGATGPTGATGPQGPQGPIGPTGPEEIGVVYLVALNDKPPFEGYTVTSWHRLPILRKEVDNTGICTLHSDYSLTFSKAGVYRIDFVVTSNPTSTSTFNPDQNVVSVGFKNVMSKVIYAGGSSWYQNEKNVRIVGQGMFVVSDTVKDYFELINTGNSDLILNAPNIDQIDSESYFAEPLVTILIQYLG